MPESVPVPVPPNLAVVDDGTFWARHKWPDFAAWPDKAGTVVVVPVVGFGDWGLGHPLDAEETVLMPLLRDACRQLAPKAKLLVVPPLRFVVGSDPGSAFAVDPPAAHALIADVAGCIGAAGFSRILLLNASPWNEELCGAAARDLRVGRGLHLFQIHLSALGLDFHPRRSRSRRTLQTVLTHLYGSEPEDAPGGSEDLLPAWGDELVRPLGGPAVALAAAHTDGPAVLTATATRLAKLLTEVAQQPPLTASLAWS